MRTPRKFDDALVAQIAESRRAGETWAQISSTTGIPVATLAANNNRLGRAVRAAQLQSPRHVRAGRASATSRWGSHVPHVVRLDELTEPQRRLVKALIEAAKAENVGDAP